MPIEAISGGVEPSDSGADLRGPNPNESVSWDNELLTQSFTQGISQLMTSMLEQFRRRSQEARREREEEEE